MLSRRSVVVGLGCSVVAAFAPEPLLAALPQPMPGLEQVLGPDRMERVRLLWSLPDWSWIKLDDLLDGSGQFRATAGYRAGLTALLNGCNAVEMVERDFDEGLTSEEKGINGNVLMAFAYFGLLPPKLGEGATWEHDGRVVRRRFAVGDSWRALGWDEPTAIVQEVMPPDPVWMMTGKTHPGSGLNCKRISAVMGWDEIDLLAEYEARLAELSR
jgi:hypothetical protein